MEIPTMPHRPSSLRIRLLLFAGLLLPVALPAVPASDGAIALLQQLRQAHGGARWNAIGALIADGQETGEGLSGPVHAAVDLRTGHFAIRARNPMYPRADGLDAQGRWHQDRSGLIHPLDSAEARAMAITESWVERFGVLTAPAAASYRAVPDATENGRRFARVEATPPGGRPATLWIDKATHRLDRAVWSGSFLVMTRRYADYRTAQGLQLPFRISNVGATLGGATDSDSDDVIERYQALATMPGNALERPDGTVRDVSMRNGASRAITPMHFQGSVVLVEASINGSRPMPFILDTGGHAILTEETAKQLGLASQGKGVSTGSGPGSMRLAYTRVAILTMGAADIRDQPFLVMPFGYGFAERGDQAPIAGILGLEIFERFAVTFDYDHGQLVLQPFDHGTPPPAVKGNALPLRFTFDMPLVDASVDGRRGVFGIDTGNSGFLLLFPQWVEREGLLAHYAEGYPQPTGGVGGAFVSRIAHVRSMRLGGVELGDPLAQLTRADAGAVGNPTEAGNIGQDLLSRFNVHFDYRRQTMTLLPRSQPSPRRFATAGLRAAKVDAQHGDRFTVSWVVPGGPAAEAGLHKGDEIVAVDGQPVRAIGSESFRQASHAQAEGTMLTLKLADGRSLRIAMRDLAPR
ncbi:signaling protein [Rhodanobacter thiooxydans]|uniref:Signaling protein n=1 Tax=Rhodanobacter thiooxydans TaxID=416169 RepID=A0A154QHW6_9GAMM|nr:aspartyl protease family protein [Rhodanobacter thiooxydans]EIM02729.1 PDZ/DHR/GLGF domain-containing protein [Rhodanobacter thiooxydans LCS2]KZC23274.1 signaling protein [Rhodanobacter thiooxydans]